MTCIHGGGIFRFHANYMSYIALKIQVHDTHAWATLGVCSA